MGSYIDLILPFLSLAPKEAEGNKPKEPVNIAASSDKISPNKLSVTITSNCLGSLKSCMAQLSASMCLSSIFLNSLSFSAWTSSFQRRPASITFDFSQEVTLFFLFFANSKATLATL